MNIEMIQTICGLPQDKLFKLMRGYLDNNYTKEKFFSKDYLMVEGDIPVCLCAHLDTVFQRPPLDIFYDKDHCVMWSPQGLGADDRAGVYAILSIIEKGYRPHIIFTLGEEMGGVGASALVKDIAVLPFDCSYLIELDRRGEDDAVFYHCNNLEFKEYIKSFGFTENFGSFTDISIFSPAWNIASVNLSVGYENEHNENEFLNTTFLDHTIEKVCKILDQKMHKYYEYCNDNTCFVCNKLIIGKPIELSFFYPMIVCNDCFNMYWNTDESKEKEYNKKRKSKKKYKGFEF